MSAETAHALVAPPAEVTLGRRVELLAQHTVGDRETTMREADPETQRRIVNRLKRARGQLDSVITAVETGGGCRDVVTQLAAVSTALDRAGFSVVSSAMQFCITDPERAAETEDGLTVEALEKLFLSLS